MAALPCASSPSPPLPTSPAEEAAPLGKHDCSRILSREWGHRKDLRWSPHAPHSSASAAKAEEPLPGWLSPGPTESRRFTWQGAYVQGVGGAAPQAGGRLHSRLGNPRGHEAAATRRPACCRSWTGQWQRPAAHTTGSCNPW